MSSDGTRALVTGGAGFVGSHLVDRLLADGHRVSVVDDLSTGSSTNVPPGAPFHRVAVGARRIVYASSAAVYGNPARVVVSETDPTHPLSEYGASKLAFEHYLGAYAARGLIEYAALRYANVYGPRQRSDGEAGVVSIFTRQMIAGEPVTIFGDGTKTRDYVFVGDVVEATIRAAAGPSGVVANVG